MPNHVDDRLTAYIHDQLDEAAVRAIERHLADCDACRAELAELQRADALAAGLATVEAPDDLWPAIERQLTERDESGLSRRGTDGEASRRWWLGAAVAALVILALAGGILVDWVQRPDSGATLDMAAFLTALEAEPRQENSREFALLPAGFEKIEPADAARAAGLGGSAPSPDAQLYGGRVLEVAGQQVVELIYGNDDGPFIVFVAPRAIEPDFGRRSLGRFPAASPTCAKVASEGFSVFWDGDELRQWVVVGRDHTDAFYAQVLRFLAAAQPTDG